jgi:predicted phosphate transport protein (TIGR00153 family)
MQESRNIFGWLGREQEKAALERARKHIDKVYETVINLQEAIARFVRNDMAGKAKAIQKIKASEHEADLIRRSIMDALTEELIAPLDREDLMHFIKSLDAIADYANGAGRLLDFLEERLPESILNKLVEIARIITMSVQRLREATNSLMNNDIKRTLTDCGYVEDLEEEADEQKRLSIEAIIHSDLSAPILMLTYQLTESMENVTDKVEDCADFIRVLAVKAK